MTSLCQTRPDGITIYYVNGQEVEVQGNNVTVKTYWPANLGVEVDRAAGGTELNWTHTDRLDSVIAITNETGALREQMAYDSWGKRRTLNGAPVNGTPTPDNLDGVTDNKGYTGHEMLDQLDLVHMNGRIYDPLVARMMSGNPYIQDPLSSQSYNRYTYVWNNPTNMTDPTGFVAQDAATKCWWTAGCEFYDYSGGKKDKAISDHENSGESAAGASNTLDKANFKPSDKKASSDDVDNTAGAGAANSGIGTAGSYTFRDYVMANPWVSMTVGTVQAFGTTASNLADIVGHLVQGDTVGAKVAAKRLIGEDKDATIAVVMIAAGKVAATKMPTGRISNPCKCFVAGTPIYTQHGLKPIEKIKIGDWVAARSDETSETAYKQVVRLVRNGEKEIIRLRYRLPNGKVEVLGVTEEHPFMLEGRRWVNAGALKPGDKIMRLAGGVLTVVSMRHQVIKQHTYNFEVEGFHTYFAGVGGAWVHNSGVDCSRIVGQLKDMVKDVGIPVQKNGLAFNVKSESELLKLHSRMIQLSKVEHAPSSTYNGIINRLEDGTRVGLRNASDTGGKTIDVWPSSGKSYKVHIQP